MSTTRGIEDIRERLRRGAFEAAHRLATNALRETPADASLLALTGVARIGLGMNAIGIALLESAVARSPENPEWTAILTRKLAEQFDRARPLPCLGEDGRVRWPEWVDRALAFFERRLRQSPRDREAYILAGRFYKATGDHRRAAELAESVLTEDADNLPALMLAAESLDNLGETDRAETRYAHAVEIAPRDPMARWQYAMRLLASGRFAEGWEGYERRHETFGWGTASYPFSQPRWQGEDLADKTLLVHGEQGFGDEIMFASILPEIIDAAREVIVATSPSLTDLFTRSFPGARVYPFDRSPASVDAWRDGAAPPRWAIENGIDFQAPIGSLARWRRGDSASFPARPYLVADASRAARFAAHVEAIAPGDSTRLRVGLNLTANLATGLMGIEKSVPAAAFMPVLEALGEHAVFVSLHAPGMPAISPDPSAPTVHSFADELMDFDATAALVDALDVVVTSDTAVAHLAAALGKPTLVMLKFRADWRYLDEGERCIWYDSMRLVRQSTPGDWRDVVDRVAHVLLGLAGERASTGPRQSYQSVADPL